MCDHRETDWLFAYMQFMKIAYLALLLVLSQWIVWETREATKNCAKIEWIASAKRPWRDFKQHQKSLCCVYDVLIIIKFVIDSAWFFPTHGRCGVIYKSWILMTNVLFNIDSHCQHILRLCAIIQKSVYFARVPVQFSLIAPSES